MADEEMKTPNPRGSGRRPAPGRARITDVADAVRVHPSTVSRVLSGDRTGRVSPATADRIREAAARLGYVPDAAATTLRTRSSRLIGVIVHDFADPVYPQILTGIEGRLAAAGYMAIVGNTGFDPDAETLMFDKMSARLVDGIILGTTRLDDPVVARARDAGMPLVSVLRHSGQPDCAAVVDDCRAGMQALARLVASLGHVDVGVIAAPQHLSTGRERLEGILDGLREHAVDVPQDRLVFVERMTCEAGRVAARDLLSRKEIPPSVIMAVNDRVALGALRAIRDAGLSCPDAICLTGYNESHPLDLIDPPLTSVAIDLGRVGMLAAERLLGMIEDPLTPRTVERITPEIRQRASLAPPVRPPHGR